MPEQQPYPEAIYLKYPGKCFWCGKLTHWADICYEGFVCSQKCQADIAEDVKRRAECPESTVMPTSEL